jgi:ATP-dependent RNA helicase DeaD
MTNTSIVPAANAPAFTELGLAPEVLKALTDAGYVTPSAIQAAAIPTLLSGQDVLGLAQTAAAEHHHRWQCYPAGTGTGADS